MNEFNCTNKNGTNKLEEKSEKIMHNSACRKEKGNNEDN